VGSDEEKKEMLCGLGFAVFLERVWVPAQKSYGRNIRDFQ
jgi:hypothetical protein